MDPMPQANDAQSGLHSYQIADFDLEHLTTAFIFRHSSDMSATARVADLIPEEVSIDRVTFREATHLQTPNRVEVRYEGRTLTLHCTCTTPRRKLCEHQRQVLNLIMNREELRIFFDRPMREARLATAARHYGMEHEKDLSQFFTLEYDQRSVQVKPKLKGLVSFTTAPATRPLPQKTTPPAPEPIRMRTIVVLSQHKYYGHFFTELFMAPLSEKGKIKAPLTPLDPMDLIWKTDKPEEAKFLAALSKFHSNFRTARSETDLTGLQALVRNPLQYDFYMHNAAASANITVGSIVPIQLQSERVELDLTVRSQDIFYEASLVLRIGPKHLDPAQVDIRYDHFMMVDNKAYLIEDADQLAVLKRFKEADGVLLVHKSKLQEFHHDFLARYERKVNLSYPDMAPATTQQVKQNGFDAPRQRIIYLSDSGDFIEITPVLTYGPLEVPVLSRKQIVSVDQKGNPFTLSRDEEAELQFAGVLIRQHPDFEEQLEGGKFAPSLRVLTLYGMSRVRDAKSFNDYEIILTSYTTLLADVAHLKEYQFNYIFLDESQAIKNPDSQRYKAARLLKARNRIVLSGTPVENNTFDLYGQLSFACPGLLGTLRHFRDHYAIPIDKFKSLKHVRELRQRINPFILRRTKEQVANELPEKTEMIVHCEMGAEQRKVYDACEREFRAFLESTPEDKIAAQSMHILQGLTKLRQLCNSPAIVKDDEYFGNESAKIDTLIEHIAYQHVHHKILVFSQFVTMLDLIRIQLETRNIPFQYLTGQTRNRPERIKDFQNNPDIRVFLISLKAGGTGLNLTQADYVYLVDPWWNPAVENQAIDRAHRIGQHKNVVAVRLICPNTIEEKILQLQQTKRELVGNLVHSDAALLKSLSSRDLLELLQ